VIDRGAAFGDEQAVGVVGVGVGELAGGISQSADVAVAVVEVIAEVPLVGARVFAVLANQIESIGVDGVEAVSTGGGKVSEWAVV
jgi:hypothetical protein